MWEVAFSTEPIVSWLYSALRIVLKWEVVLPLRCDGMHFHVDAIPSIHLFFRHGSYPLEVVQAMHREKHNECSCQQVKHTPTHKHTRTLRSPKLKELLKSGKLWRSLYLSGIPVSPSFDGILFRAKIFRVQRVRRRMYPYSFVYMQHRGNVEMFART